MKAGRKRKPGRRKPCGRLAEERFDPKIIAATMPHRRGLPAVVPPDANDIDKRGQPIPKHDQRAENPFGCLNLIGAVTNELYDAGIKYRDVTMRYRAVISAPNPNPKALNMGEVRGMAVSMFTEEQAKSRRDQYMRAFEAITGHRSRELINDLVIHGRPLKSGDLPWALKALDELKAHFNDRPAKRGAA